MIVINNKEELEKYKKIDEKHFETIFEFTENGKLADVQMNIDFVPTTDSLMRFAFKEEMVDDLFNEQDLLGTGDLQAYIVKCNDISFKKSCCFECLIANSLKSCASCAIDKIFVEENISGTKIEASYMECKNITAKTVSCDNLFVTGDIIVETLSTEHIESYKTLKVKDLNIKGCLLTNVTSYAE